MVSVRLWGLYLLLAVLAAAVYVPALGGDFVLDDGFNIQQNYLLYVEELRFGSLVNAALSFHDGNGLRPLPMLSFALDYWRAGSMDPAVFKETNLFIHGLTAFFLAFFINRLLLVAGWSPRQAFGVAGLIAFGWAVHPLQVSSVMYVVQRMQTMATLFVVLSLWSYLGMRQLQISGRGRGRLQGILMLVFWGLALACKEDAVLVLAYMLVLELTVLRFRAVDPVASKGLKQSYLALTVLGLLGYFFIVIPHYWSWDNYYARDFTSVERLLTQARVLVMYLGQILVPLPDRLTFLYDNYPISRGVFIPWTTLPALICIIALLVWAWCWRAVRPLFSLGVMIFFSGHFITSNVIGLELVFEHRNYFPILGVLIALADLLVMGMASSPILRKAAIASVCIILACWVIVALHRAWIWGDAVRHGEKMVRVLPDSKRAWMQLSGVYFDRYKAKGDKAYLVSAVEVIESGLVVVNSPALASNLIIYKSLLGNVAESDWQRFNKVLRTSPSSWDDKFSVWTQMNNVDRGFGVDAQKVIESVLIVADKTGFKKEENLRVAFFIYENGDPENALPFFIKFVEAAKNDGPGVESVLDVLEREGRDDWVDLLNGIRMIDNKESR